MRRSGVTIVAVLVAAFIGCGPGKELPDEVPKLPPPIEPTADPGGKPPAASDPGAKAVVERAVKAITRDTPAALDKAKTAVIHYRGVIHLPQPNGTIKDDEATQLWEVVWPDRARVTYDFKVRQQTFFMTRPQGWMVVDGREDPTDPNSMGRFVKGEIAAQFGAYSGLLLADSQAIVFDPRKSTNPSGTVVKIAVPDLPVVQVTFAEPSGLPVRVEYHPLENGRRVKKVLVLANHRVEGGLLVPGSIEFLLNDKSGEEWKLEKWEFPEKIDEAKFLPSKQRAPGG